MPIYEWNLSTFDYKRKSSMGENQMARKVQAVQAVLLPRAKAWRAFGVVFFALAGVARADGNLSIQPDMIRFQYLTVDGSGDLPCTHQLANAESQDWNVTCQAAGVTRNYLVHLWVTTYSRPTEPKFSIETLYWITDLNGGGSSDRGSTSWYNFKDPSDVTEIDISQWLEDGSAELALKLNAQPSHKSSEGYRSGRCRLSARQTS